MRTVDEIMRGAAADSAESAESAITLPRYPRTQNIDCVRSLSKVSGLRTTIYLTIQWIVLIAAFAAAGVPTAMLFIRNDNGSHNPDEAMRIDDFMQGVRVLTQWLAVHDD